MRRQKAERGLRKLQNKVISLKTLGDEVTIKSVIYAVREVEMIDLYIGLYFVEIPRGRHYLGNIQRDGKIISECLFEEVQKERTEVYLKDTGHGQTADCDGYGDGHSGSMEAETSQNVPAFEERPSGTPISECKKWKPEFKV